MFYLLWGLLNVGIFIFFIAICFKATKLVREKMGIFAAVVFAMGLLSFISLSNSKGSDKEPLSNPNIWSFNSPDSVGKNSTKFIDLDLQKTWISTYKIFVVYAKDNQLVNNIPVSAHVAVNGFTSGTKWTTASITVNRTDDNQKFEYNIDGTVDWGLLGFTIYSQSKNWKGFITLK